MWTWIGSHLAVILICLTLVAMVVGAIAVLVRDKKRGKSSCGGSCASCPMGGHCHGADKGAKQ